MLFDKRPLAAHNAEVMIEHSHIRNFVIIAHIDHGKSTLADRFLEFTGAVEARKMKPQLLDQMDLERERGITIKMQPVRMLWHPGGPEQSEGQDYVLNLIDTPGHIDFSYEVSRALAAVEGALLLVDATQGVQAQTLTNLYIAREQKLVIIPVLNKIDLPEARVTETENELIDLLGVERNSILKVSAKTGEGIEGVLQAVVEHVPPLTFVEPEKTKKAKALIFDSKYENHKGIIAYTRVFEGSFKRGDHARLVAGHTKFDVKEVGVFIPSLQPKETLGSGEIGYIVTGMKDPRQVHIGDTISYAEEEVTGLPGYREPKPMIWASFYPESQDSFDTLRDALEKLKLNDAALAFEVESSPVMGRSFKCGFLGMLHLEIVTERLEREFSLPVITTSPSIAYTIVGKDGSSSIISSPVKFPTKDKIVEVQEPWLSVELILPHTYLGDVLTIIDEHEGTVLGTEGFGHFQEYTSVGQRIKVMSEMPLREVVSDFFDTLKSVTSGYASMHYEEIGLRPADVEKLDILVAEEVIPALSRIVSKQKVQTIARSMVKSLKEILPRQLFTVKIQAEAQGRVIASETLTALKKDVTGYLYGGDRTRKMKLWKKQKEGKKRLQQTGRVNIPSEVYLKMLKK